MTDRVSQLRDESLKAEPWISSERAELMTRFYRDQAAGLSVPVARAKPAPAKPAVKAAAKPAPAKAVVKAPAKPRAAKKA